MQLLFTLYEKVAVSIVRQVIQGIYMDGIVIGIPFMDIGFLIVRISGNVDIGTITGKKPVTMICVIPEGIPFRDKQVEQIIPAFMPELIFLLDKGRCSRTVICVSEEIHDFIGEGFALHLGVKSLWHRFYARRSRPESLYV